MNTREKADKSQNIFISAYSEQVRLRTQVQEFDVIITLEDEKVNLVQFLKKVDDSVSGMTKEQLQSYVHELARTLPENKRQYFLDTMNMVQGEGGFFALQADKHYDDLYSEMKAIKDVLANINDGDRCLDSEYNVEWDEWYNSDAEEVLFSDPERLLQDIEKGIELLHKCIDMEAYKEGGELAELLSVLEVSVIGDYNEYDGTPLGIQELYDHNLLGGTFEKVVGESLYLAYMGNELSVRAEELYCMMGNYNYFDVTLEDIMQDGKKELPEFKEFLLLWIDYLGSQAGRGAKALLQEAQAMLEDNDQILHIARKFVNQHPELYKQLLQRGDARESWDKMLQIGLEALDKIPVTYILRSEIALLTAEFANRLNDITTAEFCWIEAFRSDTSVVNYMRIRFMAKDWKRYSKQVKQIYDEAYEKTKMKSKTKAVSYYDNVQRLNSLHHNTYCAFLFFDGDYENLIRLGLSEKKALGWSSTFMKEGLALFLLLLYKGNVLSKGLDSMLGRVIANSGFRADDFLAGTCLCKGRNDRELFWELFCKWKVETDISEENYVKWMKMIERFISVRTEGIMDANHRNYYGECAAFIAAYGEVLESRGAYGAKADIMEEYKVKYSRRRAFHQELRNYGMWK